MAGQKLKHKRRELIENLTDEQAVTIARDVMKKLGDAQLLAILAGGNARRHMHETRAAIVNQIAADPDRARLVVMLQANHPSVEKAIGLTRSPTQMRTVDHLARVQAPRATPPRTCAPAD